MYTTQDLYGVMGNPVSHSLSPDIHTLFARQTKQNLIYKKIFVPLDNFNQAIKAFSQQGGKGLNITLPFKQQAFELATEHRSYAKLAQAANTLTFADKDKIIADNTDGIGLVNDLCNNHIIELAKQRILVLGASGAARGVIGPLLAKKPAWLHIANRTQDKAQLLAKQFRSLGNVSASGLHNLGAHQFDLIINATSASLQKKLPPLASSILAENCCCYDMVYLSKPTVFLQWANQHGAIKCLDGLGMLVEQAAESFYIWRGIRPHTHNVLEYLRLQLSRP